MSQETATKNGRSSVPLDKIVSTDNGYEHKINLDGVSGFIFSVKNEGHKITVSGWNNNHWGYKEGQRVLLIQKDGTETRYKIDSVTHCGNPNDQYFIDCSFHPRM